jgi:hypothetical protein
MDNNKDNRAPQPPSVPPAQEGAATATGSGNGSEKGASYAGAVQSAPAIPPLNLSNGNSELPSFLPNRNSGILPLPHGAPNGNSELPSCLPNRNSGIPPPLTGRPMGTACRFTPMTPGGRGSPAKRPAKRRLHRATKFWLKCPLCHPQTPPRLLPWPCR